jgi:hypothetical protein
MPSVTIRDDINRRKRKAQILALLGFALLMFGALLASTQRMFWLVAAIGFAMFLGGTLYQSFGIRCPRCACRIDLYTGQSPTVFSIPAAYRFCPFCGISLDTQLDETRQV